MYGCSSLSQNEIAIPSARHGRFFRSGEHTFLRCWGFTIEDMWKLVNVDATCCYIRRNQNSCFTRFKIAERLAPCYFCDLFRGLLQHEYLLCFKSLATTSAPLFVRVKTRADVMAWSFNKSINNLFLFLYPHNTTIAEFLRGWGDRCYFYTNRFLQNRIRKTCYFKRHGSGEKTESDVFPEWLQWLFLRRWWNPYPACDLLRPVQRILRCRWTKRCPMRSNNLPGA